MLIIIFNAKLKMLIWLNALGLSEYLETGQPNEISLGIKK